MSKFCCCLGRPAIGWGKTWLLSKCSLIPHMSPTLHVENTELGGFFNNEKHSEKSSASDSMYVF